MTAPGNRSRFGTWTPPGGKAAPTLLAVFLALTLAGVLAAAAQGSSPVYAGEVIQDGPLCNFGVNAHHAITLFDTSPLRLGWYIDYAASASPTEPNGADYAPVIRIQQDGPGAEDYSYTPNGAALQAAIAGNPGAVWLIGNEPDSPLQDNLLPHIYASAYHELYYLIKGIDPSAEIFAGNIVQPTEIRLIYLDMVLESYQESYGTRMPADGWGIHNFILNEVDCDYWPNECWGAFIPPGVDVTEGERLGVEDNGSYLLFVERIERFRSWMAARGYRDVPLYLSEYGILMPYPYLENFPPEVVNDYMNSTFDYLLVASDAQYGFPHDENRLVQKLSWYSTSNREFNGWLFDPATHLISPMGLNYAAYVDGIQPEVDLFPSGIYVDPAAPISPADPVTLTITATIDNSGNTITSTGSVTVRFYDGNPGGGGNQIGGDQNVSIRGCGDYKSVSVVWPNVPPGPHKVYVVADPENQVGESDETNNTASRLVLIASNQVSLPFIAKPYYP